MLVDSFIYHPWLLRHRTSPASSNILLYLQTLSFLPTLFIETCFSIFFFLPSDLNLCSESWFLLDHSFLSNS